MAFLSNYHFPRLFLSRASRHAFANGTTAASELLAHGMISEDAYYRTLAEHHGVDFLEPGKIEEALTGSLPIPVSKQGAWCRTGSGDVRALFAPDPASRFVREYSSRNGIGDTVPLSLTTPSALRAALIQRSRLRLGEEASERLATANPVHSAKFGAGSWHGFILGTLLTALATGLAFAPGASLLAVHAFLSVFFLSCVLLRVAALTKARTAGLRPLGRYPNTDRPVYSVIVALHHEAPVVPDLVRSLKTIRWPRSKLEIKLVCEEGDSETLRAIIEQRLDPRFEVIEVPAGGPQTKPKALNFALPFCTGELVTLYDAEDRPHPDQLEEAWQVFRAEKDRLGALQAPLVIANPRRNFLTALFHLEYAALFGCILPWLAHHNMPIPLGGTSTHFRGIR